MHVHKPKGHIHMRITWLWLIILQNSREQLFGNSAAPLKQTDSLQQKPFGVVGVRTERIQFRFSDYICFLL